VVSNADIEPYVVGLGTSAGGLEALERFFKNMPSTDQFAFLVVQHLSPDYKSHMVELLSKHTNMTVHEARDGVEITAGNIYLLPPRKNMTIFKKKLYLVDYDRSRGLNLPIDILFESLAKDQRNKAVGCILSGTGSDGTRGIRAIKEYGGIVLAQDDTARFDGMPRSAIATQLVDYVAAPERMPEILMRYIKHPGLIRNGSQQHLKLMQEKDLVGKVLAILRDHNGVDFTGYKPNTLIRRIERRMSLYEITSLEQYIDYLQKSSSERKVLFKEFLISVTSFFRDPEAFEYLQQRVIPALLDSRHRKDQVRVWVPGCATGEEAYSLAILFQEHMEVTGRFADVKIFATDIDREALERAGQGRYPESIMADIPTPMLNNYFVKQGEQYEILRQIRSMVVFAYQNLVTDPPFSRIDLVSCRNLLIYLQPAVQNRIFSIFQFALKPGGFLFLGSSESLGEKAADFTVENSKWKIYSFRGTYNPLINTHITRSEHTDPVSLNEQPSQIKPTSDWRSGDAVLRSLVEHVMPPCIVVDEKMNMIHGFGELDPYLRAPRGLQVNLNVLKLVEEDLSIPLSTALNRTFKDGKEVTFSHVEFTNQTGIHHIDLTTRLFWYRGQHQKLILVLFVPIETNPEIENGEQFNLSEGVSQRIGNLEQELQYTRENLQATIEELETSNEELQATNEELMAANEELQSTNEELESVNEELLTVNNEYQVKIKELGALNDDMNNLLKSIDIGTVFLDSDLNVRKFTPAAQNSINLLEQDIGRPIHHFAHKLVNFELVDAIESVTETLVSSEHEVQDKSGRWYLLRITPYRTHTNQINGVVLALVDITELKIAASAAERSNQFTQVILNSLSAHIAVLDSDGTIVNVNDAWRDFAQENGGTGLTTDVGTNYLHVCRTSAMDEAVGASESFNGLSRLLAGEISEFDLEYPCHAPHEKRWFLLRAVPLNTNDGRVVISHINITQRKLIENAFRRSEKRFKLATQLADVTLFEQNLSLEYTWVHHRDGIGFGEEVLGKTDAEVFSDEAEISTMQSLKQRVLNGESFLQTEIQLSLDGICYRCEIVLESIEDDAGQIEGLIGACSNWMPISD